MAEPTDGGAPATAIQRLAACRACGRRHDVSGRPPGETLVCACGGPVIIPAPSLGDAEVVRCSACGSPRRGREPACSFCGADFTLHERDLDLVCPSCLHRTSRTGRFCHHCGIPLLKDQATSPTEVDCPACDTGAHLHSRRLGNVAGLTSELAVLECPRCAGLWLEPEIFRLLEEKARQSAATPSASAAMAGRPGTPVGTDRQRLETQTRAYRPCVVCGQLMHRRNYARSSGVLIDECREHGAWFDLDELASILLWIRAGGLDRQTERANEEQRNAERRERMRRAGVPAEPSPRTASPSSEGILWLLELIYEALSIGRGAIGR